MEQPAAVLNAAVGAHLRHAHLHLQVEVLHHGARTFVVNVVLARCLRRVRMDSAVIDRPNIGLAVPSVERLTVPELHVTGVIIVSDRLRPAVDSLTAALSSAALSRTAQRREGTRDDYHQSSAE